MRLIDRLRPAPRWKHLDALVRLEALRELPDTELAVLDELASKDADARVRRAAVARLREATVLGRIASLDADGSVRDDAIARLVVLAAEADEEPPGRAAVQALSGTADSRSLVTIAKGARLEAVGRAALDALRDVKALSAVARQSRHQSVAHAALARVDDPAELAQVALRSEHREVASVALDRVTDREAIEEIASRAKHKAVARHARALLRQPGEPEPPVDQFGAPASPRPADEASETPVAPEPDDHQQHSDVAASLDAPADAPTVAPSEPAEAAAAPPAGAPPIEAPPPAIAESAAETVTLAPEAPPAAPAIADTPEQRAEKLEHLRQLLDGADQLLGATDLPDARTRWNALRRDWVTLVEGLDLDEDTVARIKAAEGRIDARESELREARSRQQHENLARLQHLCDQLEKVAQAERLTLRDAERALREARTALDTPGPLPSRQDQQAVVARLKSIQSLVFPRVRDLREADEWERWANAGVQESLIHRLEALREQADPAAVARQLRQVQDEWHKVRAVPREKGRELWQRYKIIESEIRDRCESIFQHVAVERADSLKAKELLCDQVEALSESTDWIRTAEIIKGLQAQWKTIGPVTPGHEKAIWERFRVACDRFFTRRKDDLTERKTVWAVNLKKREEICAAIEALAGTADWDHALAEVKRLQSDWRIVGPVKRSRADALLLRFRAACEKFFEAYAHRNDQEVAQQTAARAQVCEDLESLLPAEDAASVVPDEGIVKKVLALRRQWEQAPTIPRAEAEPLAARFAVAMSRLTELHAEAFAGTDLDPEANRKRLEQLCELVEGYAGEERPAEGLSPAAILASQWREALAANTIGGRVDDDAKWRNAAEEIRKAQAAWRKVGPVPDATARELNERFVQACNRFFRQREQKRKSPSAPLR